MEGVVNKVPIAGQERDDELELALVQRKQGAYGIPG